MKIQITITKEEHNRTANIMANPCAHIECGQIDCEICPLREYAVELRKSQERFMRALNEIEVEKND